MKLAGGRGFTLVEVLAVIALLAILVIALAQITTGALGTMNTTNAQLDALAETRALSDALESDLRLVTAPQTPERSLGFSITEDETKVQLALNLPVMRVRTVEDYGPVADVLYVWDKKTKALTRAEYHAIRDPDLVKSTGASEDGADDEANERRRTLLAPAQEGDSPPGWIDGTAMQTELIRSGAAPLLTAVADLEITCFSDLARRQAGSRNEWSDPAHLPAVVRVRAWLAPNPALARDPKGPGLRPVELLVPVAQFDSGS
jgi:prepilin-type N-terminal cleavage/methylation domain-containing protein